MILTSSSLFKLLLPIPEKGFCVLGTKPFLDIFVDFYQIVFQFLQSLSLAFIVGILLDVPHKPPFFLSYMQYLSS